MVQYQSISKPKGNCDVANMAYPLLRHFFAKYQSTSKPKGNCDMWLSPLWKTTRVTVSIDIKAERQL